MVNDLTMWGSDHNKHPFTISYFTPTFWHWASDIRYLEWWSKKRRKNYNLKPFNENCRWLRSEITTKLYGELFVFVVYCVVNHKYSVYKTNKTLLLLLTLIREIHGVNPRKNPKRGTITERFLRKKSRAQHWIILYMFLCFRFFQKWGSVTVPKMAYIFVQRGIFPLILAYAIWNMHHNIAKLALYLHI